MTDDMFLFLGRGVSPVEKPWSALIALDERGFKGNEMCRKEYSDVFKTQQERYGKFKKECQFVLLCLLEIYLKNWEVSRNPNAMLYSMWQ